MCRRIFSSQDELEAAFAGLKLTACPHCKSVGNLIRHGFLRGYDDQHLLQKTIRARRIFCSNRNRATGCGRTFSVWLADRVRRLFLSAESLWKFLKQAVSRNNKWQAFCSLNSSLTDSAPHRLWKRFQQAQSGVRTALATLCSPPQVASACAAELTLAHLESAFAKHSLNPVAAFQVTFQTFFM